MPRAFQNKPMNAQVLCKLTSWFCLWCSYDLETVLGVSGQSSYCLLSFLLTPWQFTSSPPPPLGCEAKPTMCCGGGQ